MIPRKNPFFLIRIAVFLPILIVTTLVLIFFSLPLLLPGIPFSRRFPFLRLWGRSVLFFSGLSAVRLSRIGVPSLQEILVCNHQSYFDIPFLLAVIPFPFRFVADDSIFRTPLFGLTLRLAGCIRVSRTSPRAPLKTLDAAARVLREGCPVLIFHEGGINRTEHPEQLVHVRFGFAHLAAQTGLPVRPLAIASLDRIRQTVFRRTDRCCCLISRFSMSIDASRLADRAALRRTMQRLHARLYPLARRLATQRLPSGGRRFPSLPDLLSLLYWKRNRFTPAQTGHMEKDAAVIRSGDGNIWLFRNRDTWIAIDSGYQGAKIEAALRTLGIPQAAVRDVFLTHCDYDHTGGLTAFPAATIHAHIQEEPLLSRRQSRWGGVYFAPGTPRTIRYFDTVTPPVFPQELPVQAVFLPGHTPGHCGYLVHDRYLCTGDAVRIVHDRIRVFYGLLNKRHQEARQSALLVSLLAPGKILCTGHSGVFPGSRDSRPTILPR